MSLSTNENTKKLWEHEFEFTYSVKLTADQLFLKASVDNKGGKDFELTFCFHTYFRVPKIAGASVSGMDNYVFNLCFCYIFIYVIYSLLKLWSLFI